MRSFITCTFPNIIRIIKSKRVKWVQHVARMEDKKNACMFSVGKPEGKRSLELP
jgi:hypothetical protein